MAYRPDRILFIGIAPDPFNFDRESVTLTIESR